jgi:NAD+ synthase
VQDTEKTLKNFRDRGEALLEREGRSDAWDQFVAWEEEVSSWLQAFGPDSDLLAEWKLLGSSKMLSGRGSNKDNTQLWQYRMAINKRLFWLKRFPSDPAKARPSGSAKNGFNAAAVIDHIAAWLVTRCDDANRKGFVVGVSGGIDSAVTSTLCAKTGKEVLALNMPIHQAPDQASRSEQHIQWLEKRFANVRGIKADLTTAFQALQHCLPEKIQDDLTLANTRSRMRMITVYAFATHHQMLVVGTGNKVEDFGVGFFTKYGDGGVDISPIADLMKSEVYELGRSLGIIDAILQAMPTDGLWEDNRSDEGQLGATYEELEWAMDFETAPGEENDMTPRQQEVLKIYRRLHRAGRHKMEPIPVCSVPDEIKWMR